jgi:hypothetical protein
MYSDKLENIPGILLAELRGLSFCSKYVIIENSENWSGSFYPFHGKNGVVKVWL